MRYLFFTTLIWAFSFGLIGNVLKGLDPLMVGSARLLIALLVFLPLLRLHKISRNERCQLIAIGAVQFGIMYICYLSAFRFIPSHLVALFSVLTPLYVVLIHDIRQRQFHKRYLLAALLSVLGASVIKAQGGESHSFWVGFALMQISGLAFAFGQVTYRDWRLQRVAIRDSEVFGLLYAGGAATALIASFLITPAPSIFWQASWPQLGVVLYLGVIASGLGFFLWNKGATLCSAGLLAAFNNALVPMAIFVSLFIFGEISGATVAEIIRLVLGSSLITVAVIIGRRSSDN
jgi:drug/metabolite transporter (DMT)-like permease